MKKIFIIIGCLIIIAAIIFAIWFVVHSKTNKVDASGNETTPISTVSEIELNSKQYINQQVNIPIKGTNDSFMITKDVKWQVPEHEPGVTVSFSIAIPYKFTVNGTEYNGDYVIGSGKSRKTNDDNNPKYDIEITNLTKNGETEIIIKNK